MLLVSLNMWIPVIGFNEEIRPINSAAKIAYLFLQSLLPTIPASFLAFGTEPLYSAYVMNDNIFNISSTFGFLAISLAAINIFGGFLVTQRMLAMYKKKKK